MLEILKAVIYGIVEGITEWLPISSTGHLILLNQLIPLKHVSKGFFDMFEVVIQLGAILAVVLLFWPKIYPFRHKNGFQVKKEIFQTWFKVIVGTIPAFIIVILKIDEYSDKHFFNSVVVAVMLILVGVVFIVVENWNRGRRPKVRKLMDITYPLAIYIGLFQVIAAVLPGTSRSGATIVGALILGVSRTAAAEFTFILAIPAMFGASLLKILKFGFHFTGLEVGILVVGMLVAFFVSVFCIKLLMSFIKKHDFKIFGWYRIALGIVVLLVYLITKM